MAKKLDALTMYRMDCDIWAYLLESLKENEENAKHGFWTDGEEILCKTEGDVNSVVNFLEDCGFSDLTTGYYDPEEDNRNGETDCRTGYYYIHNIFG